MNLAQEDQQNSRRVLGLSFGPRVVQFAGYSLIGGVVAWLVLASALVDIEYYDGLSAMCNAAYFLGRSTFYLFDRGPLMAWIQMPAAAVTGWLTLHPLDVRPHHATMALLHAGYLIAVYRALTAQFGYRWSTIAAFTSAVTSYMFFSYAPFVSHDLFPGALLLGMLIWSEDVARAPRVAPWLWLVAAGTVGPLVKQTYGVFWIAVIAAHALPTVLGLESEYRTSRRALSWLAAGAATSGLLTWIIYGVVLSNWAPEMGLWVRPYRNLQYLGHIYDGTDVTFPLWIYVRNLWAYGRLMTLLLVPGLALSLTGSRLQRRVALAWITAVLFMHALPLREVRYIAFLAPLSAFIVVPAASMLRRHPLGTALMAVVLALDVGGAVAEAARIRKPFYRHSELKAFLEPVTADGRLHGPIFHMVTMLSFVAPDQSPLAADRYHRIFHAGVNEIAVLYRVPPNAVAIVLPTQLAALSAKGPEGSVLIFSNAILAHGPFWVPAPPVGSDSFVQGLATLRTIAIQRRPDGVYETSNGNRIAVEVKQEGSRTSLVFGAAGLADNTTRFLVPVAFLSGNDVRPLEQDAEGRMTLSGLNGSKPFAPPDRVIIRSFVIQRLGGLPASSRVR